MTFDNIKFSAIFIFEKAMLSALIFGSLLYTGCDEVHTPKPKGYFRIDLPEKKYGNYQSAECPFEFDLPQYAVVVNYHDSLVQPCWKYIRFPVFNGEIFLSYKKVDHNLATYLEDARALAYKHTVKAESIDETLVETQHGVSGMIYDIGGNAASSIQFYATDSTSHFLRGALYFNVAPQPDSLAPVIQFLREDVVRMMTSLKWK
jgi:gliding motility-associated lipoprotein GldD